MSGGAGDGEEVEDLLMLDLTHEEIKAAFRLFDDSGEGFITVMRFRVWNGIMKAATLYLPLPLPSRCEFTFQVILKEIDEEFTEDELDEIIAEVTTVFNNLFFNQNCSD